MKKSIIYGLTMFFLTFLNTGCSDKEEDPDNESYIEIAIGDDIWEPTEYTSVLTNISSLNGHRYDLFAQNEDYQIFLAAAEESAADCITEKDYTATGDNLDEVLMFFYFKINGNYVSVHNDKKDVFNDEEESDVIVTITSCSGDTISGTFSGTFYTEFDIPDDIVPQEVVISGEFKNLPFTRQEF